MSYVLFGIAVVVVLLAADAVRVRVHNRRMLERLASSVDTLRAMTTREVTYTPLGPSDVIPPKARPAFEAFDRELREHGMTATGDLVEAMAGAENIERWFRDGDGSIFGWFGVTASGGPAMVLFSESDDGRFVLTERYAPGANLVRPPFMTRQRFDWEHGLGAVLDAHRARLAGASPWRRAPDAAAGAASLLRLRAAVARWRAEQPPDPLLEADLRSMLAERWDELGPMLLDFMRARAT